MQDAAEVFLHKAQEALSGAESEFANARYNNCANRSYYACFLGAISALIRAGVSLSTARQGWGHAFVQQQFVGELINRRKLYPGELRDTLARTLFLRHIADYKTETVSEAQAGRALRRARRFLAETT